MMGYHVWKGSGEFDALKGDEFENRASLIEHLRNEKKWDEPALEKMKDDLDEKNHHTRAVQRSVVSMETIVGLLGSGRPTSRQVTDYWHVGTDEHVQPIRKKHEEHLAEIQRSKNAVDRWINDEEDAAHLENRRKRTGGAASGLKPMPRP